MAVAVLLATTAGTAVVAPTSALAQSSSSARSFDIPAQALPDALILFGRQAAVEVTAESANTRGRSTNGVSGNLSPAEALSRLLTGTGLTFRWQSNRAVVVEPAPQSADGAIQLGPVRVEGQSDQGSSGLPLSITSDAAATEGTGSYTTGIMATATKLPLSIRETPQSVTVITRQRMDDQDLRDINEVINATPGLVFFKEGPVRQRFYARGLNVENLMFDGLPSSINTGNLSADLILSDLALYDRVEVVRGAAGLTQGNGSPSAAINMVRKRPTRDPALHLLVSAGNWDRYRVEADASGAINAAGSIRARGVAAYQDNESFQDVVDQKRALVYGVVEADLTPTTMVTLGGSYQQEDNHNMWGNLPAAWDGSDLHLPRSTYLGNRWGYWNKDNRSAFAELTQAFGQGWNLRLAANALKSNVDMLGVRIRQSAPNVFNQTVGRYIYHEKHVSLDGNVSGPFQLLGREHQLVVGASYRDSRFRGIGGSGGTIATNIDIYDWDHDLVARPASIDLSAWFTNRHEQLSSAYATTRLNLTDNLKLIIGGRLDWYKSDGEDIYAADSAKINGRLTKYAGIVYDVDRHHSLYASYTDIFKAQTLLDQNSKLLAPIVGRNYEIGAKGEYFDGALNAQVAAFLIDEENRGTAISDQTQCPGYADDITCYEAAGLVRSKGFEIELNGALTPDWQIGGGYSYARAVYRRDDDPANIGRRYDSSIPVETFKLTTTYRLPGALSRARVGGTVNWQSGIYAAGLQGDGAPYRREQKAYAVTDMFLAWEMSAQLTLKANVGNLFDKRYFQGIANDQTVPNIGYQTYGMPRNVMVTARANF
ncbi:TonB-dependent siderophore receptor [Novosphingobium sp. BL-8H]|uniref:TonB-dependent siderophore receptor n=1 Tax=Novosphingobium sp. BL-8H TaxID=3127640 RepID=UPI0037563447